METSPGSSPINTKDSHIRNCRVCGREFFSEPLLRYENMPKAAQFLPNKDSLEQDRGVELEVCQCSGCGLVQLSNEPVWYYKEVIRAAAFSKEMGQFRVGQFGAFVEKHSLKGKKVVEIGCGRGEYLSIIQGAGADAHGLEYSEEAVRHCLNAGLKTTRGYVDSLTHRMQGGPFEAFFILSFLEHFPDPGGALGGICNNLTDNAVGLVEVPNFDLIVREGLFSEFIGDHLSYFTKETLETALTLNGFEVLECQEVWYDYILSAVVKRRAKADLVRFHEHQAGLKKKLEEYIGRFREQGVAVWGAGHQAFALMALAELGDKIRYVVDSAPFKQGKYTPATHLRIVPPETLATEPVGAVLVMAGAYSDEVVKIIRQKYGQRIAVAILRGYGLETA